jgi:hypothetical protein
LPSPDSYFYFMKIIASIFFTLFYSNSFCQKYDNNWQVCHSTDSDPPIKFWFMNFDSTDPIFIKYFSPFRYFRTSLVMSDAEGQVVFYSNSCNIADASHSIMENGDSINLGYQWDSHGGELPFSSISVPDLNNEDIYYFFYSHPDTPAFNGFLWPIKYILYSVIDKNANNGLGAVVSKDDTLLNGVNFAFPAIVKHANGRDWWIITPDWFESKYNTHLLGEDGISTPFVQEIGYKPPNQFDGYGNKLFTPDGSKYLDFDAFNGIRLFDFDRCTGLLSNPKNCDIPVFELGGAAFSANSRFLYVTQSMYLLQYDLEADDLCESVDTLAYTDDNKLLLFPVLAPDGKIYIHTTLQAVPVMQVIHYPDQKGDLAQFEWNALTLPCDNIAEIPNYPNYRLYDIPGSPCDTLGIDDPNVATLDVPEKKIAVFPNPASEMIYADVSGLQANELHYTISDITGRVICTAAAPVFQEKIWISCAGLADGVYFLSLFAEGMVVATEKVVVLKDR